MYCLWAHFMTSITSVLKVSNTVNIYICLIDIYVTACIYKFEIKYN